MLDDPALWPEIARQFQPLDWYLSPHYRLPRDYLVAKVEQAGGFAQTPQDVPERARPLLRLLNRLVIQDLLDTFVWEKAFHLDEYDMHNWKQRIEGMTLASPVLTIEDAGYQLVQEYKKFSRHTTSGNFAAPTTALNTTRTPSAGSGHSASHLYRAGLRTRPSATLITLSDR